MTQAYLLVGVASVWGVIGLVAGWNLSERDRKQQSKDHEELVIYTIPRNGNSAVAQDRFIPFDELD